MASVLQGIGVVNFEVYVSGLARSLGLATVELGTVTHETVDMKGNGLMGTTNAPVRGNLESVELKLSWRVMNEDTASHFRHENVALSLYSVQEYRNSSTGALTDAQHRLEVTGVPKSWNLGKWEPSATVDAETTIEVWTLAYYINSVERLKFDKANYVMRVDGFDEASGVRRGLGII